MPPARSSDPVFALAAGLYAGLVATPVALAGLDAVVTVGPAGHYAAFLSTVVAALAVAWLAFEPRPHLVVRLGGTRLAWAIPLAALLLAAAGVARLSWPGPFGVAAALLGVFAAMLGSLVVAVARSRRAGAALAAADSPVSWTAGWPRSARRRLYAVAAVVGVAGAVAWVADGVVDPDGPWFWGQTLVTIAVVVPQLAARRTYTATPSGLVVDHDVLHRLLPWSAVGACSVTDDAVVLHRRWRPDLRFAVADLEDPDAVVRAVEGPDAIARPAGDRAGSGP